MKKYNILWVDDRPEEGQGFRLLASQNQIDITHFTTHQAGIAELDARYEKYDGVILDALGYDQSEDESEELIGLQNSVMKLKELSAKKIIPHCIYSAQMNKDIFSSEKKLFGKIKIFDKTGTEPAKNMIAYLKKEADKELDTQLKYKYAQILSTCTDEYFGKAAYPILLDALKKVETGDSDFNGLRNILELLFKKLNGIGLIPNEVYDPQGWINGSGRFINGTHNIFVLNDGVVHPTVQMMLNYILNVCQDACHIEKGKLRYKILDFTNSQKTENLYKATVYQLLDILLYFKKFIDENPSLVNLYTKNTSNIIYEGAVEKDDLGNYYCGPYILAYMIVQKNYALGDEIEITATSQNENNKSSTFYKEKATKFHKKS